MSISLLVTLSCIATLTLMASPASAKWGICGHQALGNYKYFAVYPFCHDVEGGTGDAERVFPSKSEPATIDSTGKIVLHNSSVKGSIECKLKATAQFFNTAEVGQGNVTNLVFEGCSATEQTGCTVGLEAQGLHYETEQIVRASKFYNLVKGVKLAASIAGSGCAGKVTYEDKGNLEGEWDNSTTELIFPTTALPGSTMGDLISGAEQYERPEENVLEAVLLEGQASRPLFFTQSGKELLFSSTSSKPVLRGEVLSIAATVECEEALVDGFALQLSPLAQKVLLDLHGKCVQKIGAGANETCKEPIIFKKLLAELGLLTSENKKVVLLLAPSDGTTTFAEVECGGMKTTLSGAIVGEIPENNALSEKQINTPRSEIELVFATVAKSNAQAIREIFLLGSQMTGQELKVSGLFGGKAADEITAGLKGDGTIEISTTKP